MPIFVKDNKYFLFIHVPKTGGTSIESLFHHSGWALSYIDFGGDGSLNHLRHCSPQHMHKDMLQSQFSLNKFTDIFMIVRNPYDRFRSEYCWANKNGDCDSNSVELWAKQAFSAFSSNSYILDNHLRTQSNFYVPTATVYKLEDGLKKITKDLMKKHNIELANEEIKELSHEKINGFSSKKVELNSNVKKMINKIYSEDFKNFGYKIEI